MNLVELERSLRQLRLGGMAAVLETRLRQAQAETMAPIDLISCLVSDELTRRADRLLERRRKHAGFRDPDRTLDNFDFTFNPKMNRSLVFDLATGAFIGKRAKTHSFSALAILRHSAPPCYIAEINGHLSGRFQADGPQSSLQSPSIFPNFSKHRHGWSANDRQVP